MGKAVNMMLSGKKGTAPNVENGPTSTGNKDLKKMIQVKDAAIKQSPGIEKTVNIL